MQTERHDLSLPLFMIIGAQKSGTTFLHEVWDSGGGEHAARRGAAL